MIKRLYLANGTLQTALAKWSEDISVDAATAAYILSVLGIGDWAYLLLSYLDNTEVIKVYLTYSGLQVDRAQDGTERHSFPAGTVIKYGITQAEIQDATTPEPVNIYPNLAGVLQVTSTNGAFVVSYPGLVFQFEGGVRAYYTESDATVHVDDWFPAAGCCTIAGNGAPLIGGPFFYVTSQPYPVESIEEYVAVNPNTRKNNWGNSGFGFGPVWTLTQPFVTDEYVKPAGMVVSGVNTFGAYTSYTSTDAYITPAGMSVTSIQIYGQYGQYTYTDEYISNTAYVLQMLMYGNIVQYNNDVEKYIKSLMAVNSITVA